MRILIVVIVPSPFAVLCLHGADPFFAGATEVRCRYCSRFDRGFVARAPGFVGAVVLTVALAMLLSALFAAALAWGTGIHPATMVLATAPGGVAQMAITAKVLELGVPVVTAFHVTRVILLLTCTGPLFAWLRRRRRAARTGGPVA